MGERLVPLFAALNESRMGLKVGDLPPAGPPLSHPNLGAGLLLEVEVAEGAVELHVVLEEVRGAHKDLATAGAGDLDALAHGLLS